MNHIAFLIPTIDRIGGAEQQVLLLATGLAKRGFRISLVALAGAGDGAADRLRAAGVTFFSLEMRKGLADPRGWLRFNLWLRQQRPEILHAHLPHAAWLARWSRMFAPGNIIVDTIHTSATGTLGRRIGYRMSRRLPDAVTAVSQSVAKAYLGAQMVLRERLSVVPNGIDLESWMPDPSVRSSVRHNLGLTGEFLWLSAGRLEPVKDFPTLLRAMQRLTDSSRLVIAGSGPLEGRLRELAQNYGIAARVLFVGFTPDIKRWMLAADGFVLASRWEGLPMTLLEAAASGLPAVATDVPGNREVVVHGRTGFLAAAESPEALANAMTALLRLPGESRRLMGETARGLAEARFSLDRVLDHWESFYDGLLKVRTAHVGMGGDFY